MAISKRITIKRNAAATIKYISNEEKVTSLAPIAEEQALSYIADGNKTAKGQLVYGHLCHPETADTEWEITRKQNLLNANKDPHKEESVVAHHFIVSFRAEDDITPEGALDFGKELIEKQFKYHQSVLAVHTNTDNLHIHLVINAHTTDPVAQYGKITRMKYNSDKQSYQDLRDTVDELSIARGLSIEKGEGRGTTWKENQDRSKGSTLFKNIIKDKIEEAGIKATDWEDFKKLMKESGVQVNERGNTISYKLDHEQMKRPIREARLGDNYSKSSIESLIENPIEEKEIPYYSIEEFPQYKTRSVSMTGRPKGMLELVLNLAQTIRGDKNSKAPKKSTAEKQKEMQALYDNQKLRKDLGIHSEAELKMRMNTVGRKINILKREREEHAPLFSKIIQYHYMIVDLQVMQNEGLGDTEEFNQAFTKFLNESGLRQEEQFEVFNDVLAVVGERNDELNQAWREVNKEYSQLAQLKEGYEKARDVNYLETGEYNKDKERGDGYVR